MTTTPDRCANCGTPLEGPYCAACGQGARSVQRPLAALAHEVVTDYFGYDGKVWRSLGALVARPGLLTVDYLEGRRARYVRPVRLYLLCSLAFFFLVAVFDPAERARELVRGTGLAEGRVGLVEARHAIRAAHAALRDGDPARADSLLAPLAEAADDSLSFILIDADGDGEEDADQLFEGWTDTKARLAGMDPGDVAASFVAGLVSNVPKAMFVLLPVFALLLKAFYVRRFYGEHLVFSLHLHSAAFLLYAGLVVLTWLGGVGSAPVRTVAAMVSGALSFAFPTYLVLALRRVYGQDWGVTVVKAAVLLGTYVVVILVALTALAILTAVML